MSIFDFGPRRKKSHPDPIGLGIDDIADSAPPASKPSNDCVACGVAMFGNQSNLCARCIVRRNDQMLANKLRPGEFKEYSFPSTGDPYLDAMKAKERDDRRLDSVRKREELESMIKLFEEAEKRRLYNAYPTGPVGPLDPSKQLKSLDMDHIRKMILNSQPSQYPPTPGLGGQSSSQQATLTRVAPRGDGLSEGSITKLLEETASFGETPFSRDSVAADIFYTTGKKPTCIFMSATNGHTLEVFELNGYIWLRHVDEQQNMMQLRMSASERARLKEIL